MWEPVAASAVACPQCGQPTERAWLTKAVAVIPDSMDHLQINGLKEPRRFRSKAERKRALKEAGFVEANCHVPRYGSDKGLDTTNWAAQYDPYTAANVKELLERAFQQTPEPAVKPLNIRWHEDESQPWE